MLSTAHRVLDGHEYTVKQNGRRIKRWFLDSSLELLVYKASHINHPCNLWVREYDSNYLWLHEHALALCAEYTRRYDRVHACQQMLSGPLSATPKMIRSSIFLTEFAQAMPDQYKDPDPIYAYRLFYIHDKSRFAKWRLGNVPEWFAEATNGSMVRNGS